jgi:4a-hydroxytetrahydrobiopterin dehydratase
MASSNAPSVLRKLPPPPDALEALIASGWKLDRNTSPDNEGSGKLSREYKFRDFSEAWGFMSRVALASEKLNVSLAQPPLSPLPVDE